MSTLKSIGCNQDNNNWTRLSSPAHSLLFAMSINVQFKPNSSWAVTFEDIKGHLTSCSSNWNWMACLCGTRANKHAHYLVNYCKVE